MVATREIHRCVKQVTNSIHISINNMTYLDHYNAPERLEEVEIKGYVRNCMRLGRQHMDVIEVSFCMAVRTMILTVLKHLATLVKVVNC